MRTRFNPSGCCCDEVVPAEIFPNTTWEPPTDVFYTSGGDAIDAQPFGSSDYTIVKNSGHPNGHGALYFVPFTLPASVSSLVGKFNTSGLQLGLSPVNVWDDLTIELVLVPRDYVTATPGFGSTVWDITIPQAQIVTWAVSGPWLPSFLESTPDIAAAYNALMGLPAGPVAINPGGAPSGRIWMAMRPVTFTDVNHWHRQPTWFGDYMVWFEFTA